MSPVLLYAHGFVVKCNTAGSVSTLLGYLFFGRFKAKVLVSF